MGDVFVSFYWQLRPCEICRSSSAIFMTSTNAWNKRKFTGHQTLQYVEHMKCMDAWQNRGQLKKSDDLNKYSLKVKKVNALLWQYRVGFIDEV